MRIHTREEPPLSWTPIRVKSPAIRAAPDRRLPRRSPRASPATSRFEDRKTFDHAIARASVPAADAAKYLQQLCKHWSHKLEVDLSDRKGVVRFPAAVVALEAGADTLLVTIEGDESETVQRMKGVVATHLDRFAFREAPLRFDWSSQEGG